MNKKQPVLTRAQKRTFQQIKASMKGKSSILWTEVEGLVWRDVLYRLRDKGLITLSDDLVIGLAQNEG